MYLLLLLIGSIGFLAMTLLGFTHLGGARAHHALSGHVPAGGHAPTLSGHHASLPAGHHASVAHQSHASSVKGAGDVKGKSFPAWLMISPLDIFGFCLGAGAAGMLCQTLVTAALLPWIAVAGALAFNLGIVKPTMAFAMRFVSKPSEGLEGIIAHTAQAVTRFDQSGRGLVKVTLDDQTTQLLASLEEAELHRGVQVNKGDEVVVIEVDPAKNTCRVTKEL